MQVSRDLAEWVGGVSFVLLEQPWIRGLDYI